MEEPTSNENNDANICIICDKLGSGSGSRTDLGDIIKITRGINTFRVASSQRQDGLVKFLQTQLVYAHAICRQKYINKKYIEMYKNKEKEGLAQSPPKKKLRTNTSTNFDWENNCLICGMEANEAKEKKKNKSQRKKITYVNSMTIKDTLLTFVALQKDDFCREIHKRISGIIDLQSLRAKYHTDCYQSIKNSAQFHTVDKKTHPRILMVDMAMKQIYKYIEENDDCQFSLQELKSILSSDCIPDDKTIKSRLTSHYGDNVIFSCKSRSNTLICFKNKHHDILSEKWYSAKSDNIENEEFRILQAAGEIIRRNIRSQVYCNDYYSASDKMFVDIDEYIPTSLSFLLSEIILSDKKSKPENMSYYKNKCKSIAHAIISAVRPRSFISPLHVALAVMFHRKFGSKKIINICNSLGFCASYKEAQLYEVSAALASPIKIKFGSFVQFVHDNADFNVDTIDGSGTFHNMGSIEIVTPGDGIEDRDPIKRLKEIPPESTIAETGNIPLEVYPAPVGVGYEKIQIKLSEQEPDIQQPTVNSRLNILWMYLKFKSDNKFPGWNGFMNLLTNAQDFEKSSIIFLPFINAAPSDYNTIYTAMVTSVDNAKALGMRTCVVTFDQPLFMKACDIVSGVNLSDEILVIVRLGSFHTLMSYMGSIGYIMGGSGIKEALCTIYAENTIDHIMSGRAYARAVRAHILLQQTLSRLIFTNLKENNTQFRNLQNDEGNPTIFETCNYTEIIENEQFKIVAEIFEKTLIELENKNKTCKLWINYYRMVTILKDFIAADRSGDWKLHLYCIELMIPLFYASGHFPYAKASQIYLQNMKELQTKMDRAEYKKFTEGYFTARRSNNFFSGISTDQTIEQTLMKSMSVEGGPFKRGVTESIVYKWIKGVVYTKDIIEGMEEFCNISFKKSNQHSDSTDARIERDNIDVKKLEEFFIQHCPFPDADVIMSIATGITGDEKINCYNAFKEGIKIMKKTEGKNLKQLKLSHKDKVNSLLTKNNKIKVNDNFVAVDPLLIFQRICVLKKSDEELEIYMNYELAPYPLALFEEGQIRKTKKSTLYELFPEISLTIHDVKHFHYVIDGGMLLHRCKWQLEEKMGAICDHYVRYLNNNYSKNAYVVFDGYKKDSIKLAERNRRALKNKCADVEFGENTPLTIGQEKFLSNSKNKSRLIVMLKKKLSQNNIFTCQAESDADRLIVETAINLQSANVIIVSEDIDVLVLLTALTPVDREIYFQKPARGKVAQKFFSSKSLEKSLPKCKEHILFLHAFTGCDTTSAFFNKGKNKFAIYFEKCKDLHDPAEVFKNVNEDPDNIFQAGVTCILALYNAPKKIKDLNALRYNSFLKGTTKNTCVQLPSLVPTSDAAFEHLKRVYLQVQMWLGNDISIENWGWRYVSNKLEPIMMKQSPAPDNLLKILFCNCKKGCGAACGCRRSGLYCTAACSQCNGDSCLNASPIVKLNEVEEIGNPNKI